MSSLERPVPPDPYDFLVASASFTLASDDMADGEELDLRFAHHSLGGANVSPHLRWSGHPETTRGFVVTCFDPDAPTASGFWHWSLVGLPGTMTELEQGAGGPHPPAATFHVRNDFGESAYGGPAPPPQDRAHRYIFVVHAIDTDDLGLDASNTPAQVGFHLAFHTVARGRMTPVFQLR